MIDKASPQVMTSQGMSLLGREPLRARDRVACCLGGWGSFCWQVFLQVQAAGKAGLDKTCGVQGVCALSVPNICLISLLPGPGPGEQVWSRLEERKGQLGLAQYQERQQGREVLVQPRKEKEGCLCEACGLVLRILLPALAPQVLYN